MRFAGCCVIGIAVILVDALESRGVFWVLARWMWPASWQEGQCKEHIAAAAGHVLGRDTQQEANGREQSLIGNSIVLGSLGLQESNSLVVRIVLGNGRSLRIDYIRMSCI